MVGLVPTTYKPLTCVDPRHKAEDDDGEVEAVHHQAPGLTGVQLSVGQRSKAAGPPQEGCGMKLPGIMMTPAGASNSSGCLRWSITRAM